MRMFIIKDFRFVFSLFWAAPLHLGPWMERARGNMDLAMVRTTLLGSATTGRRIEKQSWCGRASHAFTRPKPKKCINAKRSKLLEIIIFLPLRLCIFRRRTLPSSGNGLIPGASEHRMSSFLQRNGSHFPFSPSFPLQQIGSKCNWQNMRTFYFAGFE